MGLPFVGPQHPNGEQCSPWPGELPRDSKNGPTFLTGGQILRTLPDSSISSLRRMISSTSPRYAPVMPPRNGNQVIMSLRDRPGIFKIGRLFRYSGIEGDLRQNRRGAQRVAELPIACTSTPEALRARREGLLMDLVARAVRREELVRRIASRVRTVWRHHCSDCASCRG